MSKAGDIFDALKTAIIAELPSARQLPNPYSIQSNPVTDLENGFALLFGSGTNTERHLACKLSVQREMTVTLTRRFMGTEANIDASETSQKELIEDSHLLTKRFEADPVLGASVSTIKWVSDSGIQLIDGEDKTKIQIETIFELEYFETL